MYRMSLMAMVGANECHGLDVTRAIKVAMVHDVAEAIVGDLTPHCGVSEEDKHAREKAAMKKIRDMLGNTETAKEIESCWLEYEQQETKESHLVKDLDKLEMILQATEYENQQGIMLQEFFDSTAGERDTT